MLDALQFRSATLADADALSELYLLTRKQLVPWAALAHSDEAIRDWIGKVLLPAGGVTLALREAELLAMMALRRRADAGWIDQLYVHPRVVGRGIGTQLLERARQELGSPIRLYTFQASQAARRFYERHGFRALKFGDGSGNEEGCPDVLYEWRQSEV